VTEANCPVSTGLGERLHNLILKSPQREQGFALEEIKIRGEASLGEVKGTREQRERRIGEREEPLLRLCIDVVKCQGRLPIIAVKG